jgi:hypothetical protein
VRQLSYLLNCGTLQIHLEKMKNLKSLKFQQWPTWRHDSGPKGPSSMSTSLKKITKPNLTLLSSFQLNLKWPLNLASPHKAEPTKYILLSPSLD